MAAYSPETLLLAALPQGLVAANHQRQIRYVNPAVARLFALDVDQWLGKPLDAFCEAYNIPAIETLGERHKLFVHGEQLLYAQTLPLPREAARADLAIALIIGTEDAQRAMMNFIGTISHELRTPLTAIRGNADLLLRGLAGPIDEEQQLFVDSIRQHSSNLTTLVDNMILIAGLDSGSLCSDREPIDLRRVIEEALFPFRSLLVNNGLTLTVDLPAKLPQVLADFEQVRRVLYQLLDNAHRYTQTGGVTVRAIVQAEAVRVEVEDTGRGISPAMQQRIFERFVRDYGFDGISGRVPGVGLGLSICKQLIELQGGAIWVTSTPSQGSRFCFTLPVA
jgi:signal transduction histidine kinase